MLLKNQRDSRRRIEIVSNIAWPDVDNEKPHMYPWSDFGDVLMRMLYVPAGTSEEEARKHSNQLRRMPQALRIKQDLAHRGVVLQ